MKAFKAVLFGASLLFLATPAWAGGIKLTTLINATQEDYEAIKSGFREAAQPGMSSEDYKDAVEAATSRIAARRSALEGLVKLTDRLVPAGERGLYKMLLGELDEVNISLLALASGDRGYLGYLKTGDGGLIRGISGWQEGIRQSLSELRRCVKMTGSVDWPDANDARLVPLKAH